jgi:spore coat polysaccharide biosynthesis protein SpsF (cytidylyltransferase family)/aryl-alcohol dehydrogenase-like predicted oxidoreductase
MYDPLWVRGLGEDVLASQVRIVLQARTSSRRLAAKVLLPIGGVPLAILCAQRLGSTGLPVTIATSHERSDDMLALMAVKAGVNVFRGSLDNVLDRFVQCVRDMQDADLVVRATADNPLPNGEFVDALLERFSEGTAQYLATAWPGDGLPYGVCAEVMTVAALRRAADEARDPFDLEHVTPWLSRQATALDARPSRMLDADHSALRATIDTLDDYLALASAFADTGRPQEIDWRELIPKLPAGIQACGPASRLTLGTVQLGLSYGIANQSGKPGDAQAAAILSMAATAGVGHLDTARAYGDSEARIGRLLPPEVSGRVKIMTKLQSWESLPDDAPGREIRSAVDASIYGSCRDLRRERLDVVMFHHGADMFRWHGAAIDRLQELVTLGVIGALGVSVYEPGEAIKSLTDDRISHVQIPFNLLDTRWLGGFAEALAKRPDVRVHARSVFLQGILLHDAATWPRWVAQAALLTGRIDELAEKFGRKSRADLCMAYVRSFAWVSTLVLGVETLQQWKELLSYACEPALTSQQAAIVQSRLADIPARLLNPSLW